MTNKFDRIHTNTNKKYIIRNCPCFNEGHPILDYYGECLSLTDDTQVCQDCTDCVMKQIYEKCKQHADNSSYCGHCSIENLGYSIIDLLQIEEVE